MPANLPPQYFEAEKRFREAREPEDKMVVLEEMMAIVPKHKGTDHLRADLRRKMSKLRQAGERKRATRRGPSFRIERQGAAQCVLLGFPNVGKSTLLARLTNAGPEIADYPFTTHRPQPGMMEWENISFQVVDTPPLVCEGPLPWLSEVARGADLLLPVLDLGTDEVLESWGGAKARLEQVHIRMCASEDSDSPPGITLKEALILANKSDLPGAAERLALLTELCGKEVPLLGVSGLFGSGIEQLGRCIFDLLGILRCYTKKPGKRPDMADPVILTKGATVMDFARAIHKDLARELKYARGWGSGRYDGQKVERTHVLQDGDTIEVHA